MGQSEGASGRRWTIGPQADAGSAGRPIRVAPAGGIGCGIGGGPDRVAEGSEG